MAGDFRFVKQTYNIMFQFFDGFESEVHAPQKELPSSVQFWHESTILPLLKVVPMITLNVVKNSGKYFIADTLISQQEVCLTSILVDECGGSIDAFGAKGDFFLDQLLAFGRTGKLAEILFKFLSLVGATAFFKYVLGCKKHPTFAIGCFTVAHFFEVFNRVFG